MIHSIFRVTEIVAICGSISSSFYYLVCLWGALKFLRHRRGHGLARTEFLPPVSILKPLKGIDPQIYESLRSHCLQDYPDYEIVFGVGDASDPAIESVERLRLEFPSQAIHLIVCREKLGENVKVSNLAQMLETARSDYLIVNDSDIRVEPDYVKRVVEPLADSKTGMVTAPYRAVPQATLGSRLEALGISTDFCAGVLAASVLERSIRFGLGSTLTFRRVDLEKIGGFESFVDYLADDYELGKRIAGLGLQIVLSDVVVETHLPAYAFRSFLAHQLRWARGVRDSRPGGYFGLVFTFGLMWAGLAAVLAHGAMWSGMLFALVIALRMAVATVVGRRVLGDRRLWLDLWLLPLRDLIAVGVWAVSFLGHSVIWRGDRFVLKDGRLIRRASS
jgi:ceramide glucosyltransferase